MCSQRLCQIFYQVIPKAVLEVEELTIEQIDLDVVILSKVSAFKFRVVMWKKSCNMAWIGLFHWPWVMSFGWTCVKTYLDFWKLKIIASLSGVLYSLKELTLLNYFIKQCLFYFVVFLFCFLRFFLSWKHDSNLFMNLEV